MLRALGLVATRTTAACFAVPSRCLSNHWWQPVLPALADLMRPNEKGKGAKRKKQQKRMQQVITNHARRQVGVARNRIERAEGWLERKRRVQDIYKQYAKILQAKAKKPDTPTPD